MKTRNRLSPSSFEPAELDRLLATLNGAQTPRLVNEHGEECPLPKELFDTMVRTLNLMKQGSTIILTPEDETLTTQAAANQLGISRQFFIGLLEGGHIPFHKVGTHRRVLLKDLIDYDKKRVREQKERIRKLSQEVSEAGHYDDDFPTTTR
jgi:excisionase family DNA binding protein